MSKARASGGDLRWLSAAACLAERGRPLSRPNPAVGCILVKDDRVIARGWTQPGGRPHAEAMALAAAGAMAKGATAYVTLEPCAHDSARGPCCAGLLAGAGVAKVVVGANDPDPRTAGSGNAMLRGAGITVVEVEHEGCAASLAGYLTRSALGRPFVTLKLALSLDGCIALASGESQWITGTAARAHTHLERARHDAILVGGGTLRADNPRLDVRLPGLEARSPDRWVLTRGDAPDGWQALRDPADLSALAPAQYLFVEGGAHTAAAFLAADAVDRLLVYRAPIVVGGGRAGVADIGLGSLSDAHGRWRQVDRRTLGTDTLEVYARTR
ncbi:bifunctional diaminohydroxyphosphoribosylaminopyrimidine deaminase/5-amino-6-(5-phosphoribosylamino)uracil reductase RibD [Croceicoccus gelatinilyticus]|uniref:bifunctional diaminohydroxyphosphoribosylaminopyrimidine deaminase/5-amino-6-(5-phosphoribosylamino)uracil reductase RibD n=1 Tax=Croceicoccus gelatinilyticus TaxID=2835536 RepID=UPI001BCF0A9C|nr:bifunctional diaminohydroxyphosphoribosylaminopyrimidine deaminase/5-amino-6-(5-phosphoribosylamino)uracil reductase RibD [Croceicoccus gelatinilyticus]MBS7671479.1 bifunctional diaminohydroxyphosphoribosylaminopyrimidine deaminase/5-amino-6-(5-phosphoribosylamino)uracil reductase RibD [Croceicoccus gelatinilyticus]